MIKQAALIVVSVGLLVIVVFPAEDNKPAPEPVRVEAPAKFIPPPVRSSVTDDDSSGWEYDESEESDSYDIDQAIDDSSDDEEYDEIDEDETEQDDETDTGEVFE